MVTKLLNVIGQLLSELWSNFTYTLDDGDYTVHDPLASGLLPGEPVHSFQGATHTCTYLCPPNIFTNH